MADFVVSTAFVAKDDMSQAFRKMGSGANMFANKAIKSLSRIERKTISLKGLIGGMFAAGAVRRGLDLAAQGVRTVADEFLSFEDALTAASAKFGVFDRSSETFKDLAKTAREVGAATEFTSAEAAEGLRFLAKAGWDTTSAMKALPGFVDLATASEMDFARAADIATDVMGAFRLQSKALDKETAAAENLKQLTRVNDVLSKAVNMSNIDMEDLFETIKFAGPIAKTAGVSLEQFSAMAAFIGGAGIKGSLGGTALRTMFLNLAAPTDKIKDKLADFNTEVKNVGQIKKNRKELEKLLKVQLTAGGKLKNPIEILAQLNKGMEKLTDTQKAAALNIIFGKRAVSASSVAMDGATGSLQKFEEALKGARGNSKKLAAFMRTSLSKRLDALKSAAIEVGFKFIDAFEKKIPGGIDAVAEAVRNIDVQAIIVNVTTLISKMSALLSLMWEYRGVLIGVGAALGALKIIAFVSGIVSAIAAVKGLVIAMGGLKGAVAVLAGISPLALAAAAALGGLAAGIYTLVTRWDELKIAVGWFVEDAWQAIKNAADKIWGVIKDVGSGLASLGRVLFMGESIKRAPAVKAPATPETSASLSPSNVINFPTPSAPNPIDATRREAGTRAERQAQRDQNINFQGRIDVAAPKGTKVASDTKGAPPVQMSLLGAA